MAVREEEGAVAMSEQPEALRLADMFEAGNCGYPSRAAAELRRLHEVNQELLEALKSLVQVVAHLDPCPATLEQARAAITKGEQA